MRKYTPLLFILLLPFLTAFQCEPYSFTEKVHVYFNDNHTYRVVATIETNGYQAEWSDLAKKYIESYQDKQDSLMRKKYAINVKKMKGKWDDKILIYAVEGLFEHDYDLMAYMNQDLQWWKIIIGYNDTTLKLTFNLQDYRQNISNYAYCYQVVAKEIISSGKITFTEQGIDSFYVNRVVRHFKKDLTMQRVAFQVTKGILSESETVVIPFSQMLFSLQKYRFHVSNKAYHLSSNFIRQDFDQSLVYFPYPEMTRKILSYAVYSPFRPTYQLSDIQQEVNSEIPEFISFYWNYSKVKHEVGNPDNVRILPLSESAE